MSSDTAPQATSPEAAHHSPMHRMVRGITATAALVTLLVLLLLVCSWHITQGTSGIGLRELLGILTDPTAEAGVSARDVLLGSRLPRVGAGLLVGIGLGVAGALFQSLARNHLASPDTLGVNGGAYLAVVIVAAFGLSLPLWASTVVAFIGGLAAAGLVLGLAGGAGSSASRLVLAGTATALALQSLTSMVLILFAEETTSLFAWGSGSLSQLDGGAVTRSVPFVLVIVLAGMLLSRRLDLLSMGDDAASVLGVPIRSTKAIGIVLAVLLSAISVTLAGPIGFVGLGAPVVTRLLSAVVPVLAKHMVLLPTSGLIGALIVITADAGLRAIVGADKAISVPTGVTTTVLGALVLVLLARRMRDSGAARAAKPAHVAVRSRRRGVVVTSVLTVVLALSLVIALLAGERFYLLGDLGLWLRGQAPHIIELAFDSRVPRVTAALLAGAALALSGTLVQAGARNPLAEPGLLGITGGAGLGAVIVITVTGADSPVHIAIAGTVGALVAFGVVYGLSWRRGINTDRFVLIGIGLWYGFTSLTTMLLLRLNPWDTPALFTWLSGTTYGRAWTDVVPVVLGLLLAIPIAVFHTRELDLLALDDDTPRLVGVPRETARLTVLITAAVLAAVSVSAVGVIGFIGLVAPHAARALVGARHTRVIPVSILLGGIIVVIADTLGRSVIAPAQIPAGLIVAIIGAPYFVYLLARSRG